MTDVTENAPGREFKGSNLSNSLSLAPAKHVAGIQWRSLNGERCKNENKKKRQSKGEEVTNQIGFQIWVFANPSCPCRSINHLAMPTTTTRLDIIASVFFIILFLFVLGGRERDVRVAISWKSQNSRMRSLSVSVFEGRAFRGIGHRGSAIGDGG